MSNKNTGTAINYILRQASGTGTGNWLYYEEGWGNKWGRASITLNQKDLMDKEGADGAISVTNGHYYMFNFQQDPAGSGTSSLAVLHTSAAPVTISSVSGANYPVSSRDVDISIALSGSKCAEEYVLVRYTTDGWTTSNFVSASGSGTNYSCTIPAQPVGTNVQWYVMTSTVENPAHADADWLTLYYNNNSGNNYKYSVVEFDNYLSNWKFDDFDNDGSAIADWPYWEYSGTDGHVASSTDTYVGNYSFENSNTSTTNRILSQEGISMDGSKTYYPAIWVKGKGEISVGIRNPHNTGTDYCDVIILDTDVWTKVSHTRSPTGTGTNGAILIRTRITDPALIIGAAWLSDTLAPENILDWEPLGEEAEEPSNHITDLASETLSDTQIKLTWTDSAGPDWPSSYLIKWSTVGYGDITAPTDGTEESDGAGVKNVNYGVEEVTINGLNPWTTYYFKIWPYAGTGTNIDYKTDGTIPQTSSKTDYTLHQVESSYTGEYYYIGSSGNTGSDSITLKAYFGESFRDANVGAGTDTDAYIFYIQTGTNGLNVNEGWGSTHKLPVNFNYAIFIQPSGTVVQVKEVVDDEWVNVNPQPNYSYSQDWGTGIADLEILLSDLGHTNGDTIGLFAYHLNNGNGWIFGITPDTNPTGGVGANLIFESYWHYELGTSNFTEVYFFTENNLLKNNSIDWSFESDNSSWTIDPLHQYPYATLKMYENNSLSWSTLTTSWDGREFTTSDSVPVSHLSEYRAGIFAYSTAGAWANLRWRIGIQWFDSDGIQIGADVYSDSYSLKASGEWTVGNWTGIVPPTDAVNAKYMVQALYEGSSGRLTFDAAYMIPTKTYEPPTAATDLSPTDGSRENTVSPEFSWTFNDPGGYSQGKFQIQIDTYTGGGGWEAAAYDTTVSTSNTNFTIPVQLKRWTSYKWRIKTWNEHNIEGVWTDGNDSFTINRISVSDGTIAEWFGDLASDADKNQWATLNNDIDTQTGDKTDGGKFLWIDAVYGDFAGEGDASTDGAYDDKHAYAHDLKYFAMCFDEVNMYFYTEFQDLRDDIPIIVQVAISTEEGGNTHFRGSGTSAKDVLVSDFAKWNYLIQFNNGNAGIGHDKVIVSDVTWDTTDLTALYGGNVYSEHITDNYMEIAVPLSFIGGNSAYFNNNDLKITVAVFRANTSVNPAIPADFNQFGEGNHDVPQAVDLISDLRYTYNGNNDPLMHELGSTDNTIGAYNILSISEDGSITGNFTVSSGKGLDGDLSDWNFDNERMETSEGDTLWLSFSSDKLFVGLEGFSFTGNNHFGLLVDTVSFLGSNTGLGGPKFDTSFTPNFLLIVNEFDDAYYYISDGTNWVNETIIAENTEFYINKSDSTLEMGIPREYIGITTTSNPIKIMAYTSTGTNINSAWPITNPTGGDSTALSFIGSYYYSTHNAGTKSNNAIDADSPPIFEISVPPAHYNSDTLWYDTSLLNDSFTITITVNDTESDISDSSIYFWWTSTAAEDNKYKEIPTGTTTIIFDITGDTNAVITLLGRTRNNYGLLTYDTKIIGFDNVPPSVPALQYPENASDTTGTDKIISFKWTASSEIDADWSSGLKEYRLQIATDIGFETIIVDSYTKNTNIDTAIDFANNEDTYYWRVASIDNVGNQSGFSGTYSFRYGLQRAKLLLSEVSPYGDGLDGAWIEIKVLESGYLNGMYLEKVRSTAQTLPLDQIKVPVQAGDYILARNVDGTSDTDTKDSGTGTNHSSERWDLYRDGAFNPTGTEDAIVIRHPDGTIEDIIIWANSSESDFERTEIKNVFEEAVSAGQWDTIVTVSIPKEVVSSAGTGNRRIYYRHNDFTDSNSRFGWDHVPADSTPGYANADTNFNLGAGSGITNWYPAVVPEGATNVSFVIEYEAEYDFGSNGRRGFITVTIPKGLPTPSLSDVNSQGYMSISLPDNALYDSGIIALDNGDTIVYFILQGGLSHLVLTTGDIATITYGCKSGGGPGFDVSAGTDPDTFIIMADPTGNNFISLPTAKQPVLKRSIPSLLEVSPSFVNVYSGQTTDFSAVVKDSEGGLLLGDELKYEIISTPTGAAGFYIFDTNPSTGISDHTGSVNYSFQTDTDVEGNFIIEISSKNYPALTDSVVISTEFTPPEAGASGRMIAEGVVIAGLYNNGTNERAVLLYNPTKDDIDISNYWFARYLENQNWQSPTAKVRIGTLALIQASNYNIKSGGWFSIGRVDISEADVYWENALITNDNGYALFRQDPANYDNAEDAANNRLDAVGFAGVKIVYEGDTVENNVTTAAGNRPHRRPDAPIPGAFIDSNNNRDDFVQGTTKNVLKNTSSDTVLPAFYLTGPEWVLEGEAFDIEARLVVQTVDGIQSDSIATCYTGDSAWAEIFVSGGTISDTETAAFVNGADTTNVNITNHLGPLTITYVDGLAVGRFTMDIAPPTPTLYITQPDTGHDTATQSITITGTTVNVLGLGYDTVGIYIDGAQKGDSVTVSSDGSWAVSDIGLDTGENIITAFLVDKYGRTSDTEIIVNYYPQPVLKITTPDTGHDTTVKFITVSGTVNFVTGQAYDTVGIYINDVQKGDSAAVDSNGNWIVTGVELNDDTNIIIAYLFDSFNRIDTDYIAVIFIPNQPPSCTITLPIAGETYGQNVTVHFQISDPDDDFCTFTIIQYSPDGGGTWQDATIVSGDTAGIKADSTVVSGTFIWNSYADLPEIVNTTVQLRIVAFDGIAYSDTFTTGNFTIKNTKPDSPVNLVAIAILTGDDTGVSLSWTHSNDADSAGYNIYVDTTGTGTYVKINDVLITSDTYLDSNVVQGETYYYAVTILDIYGNESNYSDSATAPHIFAVKSINSITRNEAPVSLILPGVTIEFYIEFTNNGFGPAYDLTIIDTLPVNSTDYKVGTADTVPGDYTAEISYSNDNGNSWDYTPAGKVDSSVTHIKYVIKEDVFSVANGSNGVLKVSVVVK